MSKQYLLSLSAFAVAAVGAFLWLSYESKASGGVVIFEDDFDQSGEHMANGWQNFSGTHDGKPEREEEEESFEVGVDGTKGLRFKGDDDEESGEVDQGALRHVATKGYSHLTVEYSRAAEGLEAGDRFIAAYSLDNGPFSVLEEVDADTGHSAVSFDILNPDRHSRLTLRFYIVADNHNFAGLDDVIVRGEGAPAFYDGFESGDFDAGEWMTEGTPKITDKSDFIWTDDNSDEDGHASHLNPSSSAENPDDAITKAHNTSGITDIKLRYARLAQDMEEGEGFTSYYSTDGGETWHILETVHDASYASVVFGPLEGAGDNSHFQIRFAIHADKKGDKAFVDDVIIWGDAVASSTPPDSEEEEEEKNEEEENDNGGDGDEEESENGGGPETSFGNPNLDHAVIDTEIVSLSLNGTSTDSSGVASSSLIVDTVDGPQGVDLFPSESFFDVFADISCPASSPIETEIVSLSLTSTGSTSSSWSHFWTPPGLGIFCFGVQAVDGEGNASSSFIGPLAYVPVVKISDQTLINVAQNSFTATWYTDKPATSRVVYDTVSHPMLGDQPNYGYASSTGVGDISPRTIAHAVTVDGLLPSTTHYYRVISTASPEAVGSERTATTAGTGGVAPPASAVSSSGGGGGGGGGPLLGTIPIGTPLTAPSLTSGTPSGAGTGGGQILGVATFIFRHDLRMGSNRIPDVGELQKRLNQEGFYTGTPTGFFGQYTLDALKAYQKKHGIPATGFLSPLTRARLNGQVAQIDTTAHISMLQAKVRELQEKLDVLKLKEKMSELQKQVDALNSLPQAL